MQRITPFLWFDSQAEEAVNFYVSAFPNASIQTATRYSEEVAKVAGRPPGSVMTISFELAGQSFTALNGGPAFTFTPAVSLFVACESEEEIEGLWEKLSEGGTVLMELQKYPFSDKFGWLCDKYGVSWQCNLAPRSQKITPCLMFVGAQNGNAEEASNFYITAFSALGGDSAVRKMERYSAGDVETEGAVKHGVFALCGYEFIVMDSALEHAFTFTPAISFVVDCETQAEVDELWEKLSEGGVKEQCGWLKDKYGVSWQVVPTVLAKLIQDKDADRSRRVMHAMLKMTKLDIRTLQQVYDSR